MNTDVGEPGLLWHRFGRGPDGYQTLAKSPLLAPATAAKLERFGWGQPRRAVAADLATTDPPFWIEPIDGLVAVTRVTAGDPDASGRATLTFFSLLASPGAYVTEVLPRLGNLLAMPELWRDANTPRVSITDLPHDVVVTKSRLAAQFLGDATAPRRQPLVLAPGSAGARDVHQFLRALPRSTAASFRVAYRCLSDAVPADLVVPDPDYCQQSPLPTRPAEVRAATMTHRERGLATTPTDAPFPLAARSGGTATNKEFSPMNVPTKLILGSTAFLVLVLGIANLWLMARNAREASVARDRHVVELQTELATLRNSIDRQTTVLGRAFEAKTAELARLAEANGQRVRAIDDRLGRLATAVDDARQEQANSVHGLMERVQLQAAAQSELQAALCTIDARVMGLRAMPALHDLVLATAQIVQTWLARRPALATTTSPPMTAPAPKIPAVAPRKDKK